MSVWLLKALHLVGLTNLTDEEVERYARLKRGRRITFTSAPVIQVGDQRPAVRIGGPQPAVTCQSS